jgi:hypothetical protein
MRPRVRALGQFVVTLRNGIGARRPRLATAAAIAADDFERQPINGGAVPQSMMW